MFNRIVVVQECDASGGDSSNEVGYKNISNNKSEICNLKSEINHGNS